MKTLALEYLIAEPKLGVDGVVQHLIRIHSKYLLCGTDDAAVDLRECFQYKLDQDPPLFLDV